MIVQPRKHIQTIPARAISLLGFWATRWMYLKVLGEEKFSAFARFLGYVSVVTCTIRISTSGAYMYGVGSWIIQGELGMNPLDWERKVPEIDTPLKKIIRKIFVPNL